MGQHHLNCSKCLKGNSHPGLSQHPSLATGRRWLRLIMLVGSAIAATGLVACTFPFLSRDYFRDLPPDEEFHSIPLISDQGVDYSALKMFLEHHQWQEADQETLQRLLDVAGQSERGWLSAEDVQTLPCSDLQTMDQLWAGASRQRFGFTVQARLWEALGGQGGSYDAALIERLGDRVGWRIDHQWHSYESLTFDLGNAPPGHLPATTGNGVSGGVWGGVPSIAGRLETCGKIPQGSLPLQDPDVWENLDVQLWQLENTLANQDWQEADFLTAGVINLRHKDVIVRYRKGDLSANQNQRVSRENSLFCEDLRAVDRVWTTYSNGTFGFSVQQALMPSDFNLAQAEDDRNAFHTASHHFSESVGWLEVEVYRGAAPWRPGLLLEPLADSHDIDLSDETVLRVLEYFERGATYDPPDDPPAGFYPYAIGISYFPESVPGIPVPIPASPVFDRHWPAGFATICPL
ncbi:MAG: hypothetical protein EA367_11355 [Leptolyngbya sp. DLM2.Bin15]|nr:MAG: hypothetical protein EA367_11355 [Leptolyngbya sp. DLM2.Bin15]